MMTEMENTLMQTTLHSTHVLSKTSPFYRVFINQSAIIEEVFNKVKMRLSYNEH